MVSIINNYFSDNHRGRESKGGRTQNQPSDDKVPQSNEDSTENISHLDKESIVDATKKEDNNQTDKNGKKGRPKSPCEPIESEPYVNIEIVKYGRDPNNTFSSGNNKIIIWFVIKLKIMSCDFKIMPICFLVL